MSSKSDKIRVGRRRLSREIALRILFQLDASTGLSPDEIYTLFLRNFSPEHDEERVLDCEDPIFEQVLPFARELFFGVAKNLAEVDGIINEASEHWRLERMSRVDRNVMRLAVYEMTHREDIPPKVSINEAVDLGKEFGAEDSGAFINGILDRIHRQRFDK